MKIMIAGLGLIGGSAARALARAGYAADGYDRPAVLHAAVEAGVVVAEAKNTAAYDVVFVALPPDAAMQWIDGSSFKDGAVVADFCGVKGAIERCVYAKPRNFRYVGCHPMAGKEVSGLQNSCADLFDGASMIVVCGEQTDESAVRLLEELYKKMGFGGCKHCSAAYHDAKIAYTSQLAHIVSNAYVKSDTAEGFPGFTGGSFQDMTRIAGVDEDIWTRLYMLNRAAAAKELERLISNMQKYLDALNAGDEAGLHALLREGRERKERLDTERKIV